MVCAACLGNAEQTEKCLSKALDTIREHFLMIQNQCAEKTNIISQLNKRNEKLHIALDVLQQRHDQRIKSSPKRRRFSPKKPQKHKEEIRGTPQGDMSPMIPESQSSLNMNIAIQPDDEEEEIITETEPAVSPYKPWNSRRMLSIRNSENEQPNETANSTSPWLGKVPKDKLPMTKNKMSLTLRSNSPKLKQTRLHFDAGKQKAAGNEKEIIESSPNLYTSLKRAKQSRSLLQRSDTSSALDTKTTAGQDATKSSKKKTVFDMDDDESFFDLCPDPSPTKPPSQFALPALSGASDTSSVVLLTPATQDIVFVDDSIADCSLNTMDFMEEAVKENDKASMTRLQEFEAELIRKRQLEATKAKLAKPLAPVVKVKKEPLTEIQTDFGNESTKLPADFELEDEQQEEEEEEVFPQPIAIKEEHEVSFKELYNISCPQCEKFITFMGTNLTDEKIRLYLQNCRHERELENNTPPGFWNPHMVSFSDDD